MLLPLHSFLDRMLRSTQGDLRINEITVSSLSGLAGLPIGESGLKERFGLLLLAIQKPGDPVEFNPPMSHLLEPGLVLIVMGDVKNCYRARKLF